MLKSSIVAATMLAVALLMPASIKQAEAMPAAKPGVKDMTLKHDVGRRGRGFRGRGFRGRGFRGRGFRGRGFRGRGLRGLRLRSRRGFRGRGFRRHRYGRRFYRPRFRAYYGAPVYYGRRSCRYLKRRFRYTGNPYWWDRYRRCKHGYY